MCSGKSLNRSFGFDAVLLRKLGDSEIMKRVGMRRFEFERAAVFSDGARVIGRHALIIR